MKNVLINKSNTNGTCLCNVLNQSCGRKASVIDKDIVWRNHGFCNRSGIVVMYQAANHYKRLLLRQQFMYVDGT